MRVLHLVPAAFNYYDDIKALAFDEIENESNEGVEVEAYTMQYQAPAKSEQADDTGTLPKSSKRSYLGTMGLAEVEKELNRFDAIHIHTPIFGGLKKVAAWKNKFPKLILVVTVHRQSFTPDFFSIILLVYNRLMLPRLFKASDFIVAPNLKMLQSFYGSLTASYLNKLVEVDESEYFAGDKLIEIAPESEVLDGPGRLAFKYIILYNNPVKK